MSETQRPEQGSHDTSPDQVGTLGSVTNMIDKTSVNALGSLESRIAARTMLERARTNQEKTIILVTIEHIGHDGAKPLPPSQRIRGKSGVTELIHVAGGKS